ncbi:MAG: hypothetical protein HY717_11030 [Planctomycetes bacterium]|nr:hypothetical protein [Planctomycetota bacterium]
MISQAKAGDPAAWEAICKQYYPQWLKEFHGELGRGLRNLYETQDLVQSAISEALRDIGDLRNEAAFHSWVSAIIRRKIAEKRRHHNRLQQVPFEGVLEPGKSDSLLGDWPFGEEDYLRLLDVMLSLFPTYPEPIALPRAHSGCLPQVF